MTTMYPRTSYEMTQEDLDKILDACKSVPMIMLQCGSPRSPQERANDAWAELGKRMGFDHTTVRPDGRGDRFFTAVPSETETHRAERLAQEAAVKKAHHIETLRHQIQDSQAKLDALLAE